MAKPVRYRQRAVGTMLAEDEYAALRAVCDALHLTVRDILLIGLRRARKIWTIERRKQRGNGQ